MDKLFCMLEEVGHDCMMSNTLFEYLPVTVVCVLVLPTESTHTVLLLC